MSKILDDFKKQLEAADQESEKPLDEYHEAARKIVTIERKYFYGEKGSNKRLQEIRELIVETAAEEATKC
jgi:hypothetical protein